MKILEIITEGLGYSTDPEQGKWYHEGRKAFKFGTTGNTIQDIAKKHGCPPEWLKAFHAGYQDQEGWGKGVSESKTAQSPKPRNFVAKNAINTGAGAHKDKKKAAKQGNVKHKKKEVAMEDASNQGAVISQEQLNQMYAKGKPMMFIKNTPVALVPLAKINQIGTPQQVQQVQKALGSVDQTSYTDEYKNKGYVVFQWNGTALDLYVASPEVVSQKYVKFNGQLPQDDKARGKIPSLVALSKLGIDPSKVPFFVKKVPTQMVSAKQLGLEGKTIQTSWGEQTVSPGGFMVREENGHIYTVAPDAKGLPIGYLPAQQGVKEDGEGGASAGSTTSAMVGVGAVYKNKRAKKQKPGTNALDMKGVNLLTGGSIKR